MFRHGIGLPVRIGVTEDYCIALPPFHLEPGLDEASLAAFIIVIKIDEGGQMALILRRPDEIEMLAILLARLIAQYLQRFALVEGGPARGGQAAIERVNGRILDQPIEGRSIGRADRVLDETPRLIVDSRGLIAGIGNLLQEIALGLGKERREQADRRRLAQLLSVRHRNRVAFRVQLHPVDNRERPRPARIGSRFLAKPGERETPVARPGDAAAQKIGVDGPGPPVPRIARLSE